MCYTPFQTVQGLLGEMSLSEGKPAEQTLTGKTVGTHTSTPEKRHINGEGEKERERENLT